jgi:hypothetical protein
MVNLLMSTLIQKLLTSKKIEAVNPKNKEEDAARNGSSSNTDVFDI